MIKSHRLTFVFGTIFCLIWQTSAAAVTDTNCTPKDAQLGDTACQQVDANAECPLNTQKCACKAGYKVDPKDNTKCLLSITQVGCTSGPAGNTKCQGLDPNSECSSGASKCACKTGFTGTDSCTKFSITQVGCTSGTAGDKTCQDLDPNSECPSSASKCACKTGFTGTDSCTKLSITQIDCTSGSVGNKKCQDLDPNSECPTDATKCTCKTGYTGTDTCSKGSSADSVKTTTTMIAMSFLVLIVRSLFLN